MAFEVGVTISGGQRINSILNQLTVNATLKRSLLETLGLTVVEQTRLRFTDQEGPDGQPWKPSRRAREEGGQTLLKTNRLRDSVTYAVGAEQVEIGTNLVYANAMQFGLDLTAKPGKAFVFQVKGKTIFTKHIAFPGRPFIGINDDDEEELGEIVVNFLAKFVGGIQ